MLTMLDQVLQDVVSTLDFKVNKKVTANSKYELATKKYQVGATWDGKLANKVTQVKRWYTNKDNLVAGEATVSLNPKNKANVTFNQKQVCVSIHSAREKSILYWPCNPFS